MKKVQVNNNIYHYEVIIKPNVYIVGITVYIWKQHSFETIFSYDDVINIQYSVGNGFSYRERAFYMVVNSYFGPIRTNIPYATPNYIPGQ